MVDKMNLKEHEVMNILSEECAEVIQAISKCHRFGIDNIKPGKPKTNREHLAEELGDLQAMIDLCIKFNLVGSEQISIAADNKIEKLKKWSTIYENQSI
jgi:NTP pyrophosphatase (non-canonical NTP hydrolase)